MKPIRSWRRGPVVRPYALWRPASWKPRLELTASGYSHLTAATAISRVPRRTPRSTRVPLARLTGSNSLLAGLRPRAERRSLRASVCVNERKQIRPRMSTKENHWRPTKRALGNDGRRGVAVYVAPVVTRSLVPRLNKRMSYPRKKNKCMSTSCSSSTLHLRATAGTTCAAVSGTHKRFGVRWGFCHWRS